MSYDESHLNKTNQQGFSNGERARYLEFHIGSEDFAIPLLSVREVISVPETTPIPKSPSYFVGIMNLRGQVISVVDLRKKLGINIKKDNPEEAVIIVSIGTINIGVIVDAISKVLSFTPDDICVVADLTTQVNAEYIQGVYRKEDKLTVLVDLPKVLDIKDLSLIENNTKEAA